MFIVFEGLNGAGKTTQIENVANTLRREGYNCLTTREPGGTEIGSVLRHLLVLQYRYLKYIKDMDKCAEFLLFLADRAQHMTEIIRPALEQNKIVLCDRFVLSTLVYQVFGDFLDKEKTLRVYKAVNDLCNTLVPDITIILDIPAEECFKRHFYENKLEGTISEMRKAYCEFARQPNHYIIDGLLTKSIITEKILDIIFPKINEKFKNPLPN